MRTVKITEDILVEKVWPDEFLGISPGEYGLKLSFNGKGKRPLVILFDCQQSMINLLEVLNLLWAEAQYDEKFANRQLSEDTDQLSLWDILPYPERNEVF
ncbi:hypothetical protein SY88_20295 [Clostridiales bacterium PH28_bin88]|nr:hypothetical protein SY88_20295 [Clostridiales bacterium PH28_bin88]